MCRRENLLKSHETRLDQILDETCLSACYVGCFSVHEIRDLQASFFLFISLIKELDKEVVCPLEDERPYFCWVGDVSKMDHVVENDSFIVLPFIIKIFLLAPILHLLEISNMVSHVCGKHEVNHLLSHLSELGIGEVFEESRLV